MNSIYFARSISLYGSEQDKRDIQTLKSLGFDVIDLAADEALQREYKGRGMEAFLERVKWCSALAFRANPDGTIGAGVWDEIQAALEVGLDVIELPNLMSRRALSVGDTREYLRLVGQR